MYFCNVFTLQLWQILTPYNFITEEQYTWVLGPKDRAGDVGVHYLVIKPIVEAGIKSVNATINIVTIAAQCKYWNETESFWSEDGCRVSKKKKKSTIK